MVDNGAEEVPPPPLPPPPLLIYTVYRTEFNPAVHTASASNCDTSSYIVVLYIGQNWLFIVHQRILLYNGHLHERYIPVTVRIVL